jgi:4-hydroxy-3-polyprenylbenzoate decarboxylase
VSYRDLSSFVRFLEEQGELKRVRVEVDPELEITEIVGRVIEQKGPALLFENVKGSRFPLLINALASDKRIEWALGRHPQCVGAEISAFAEDMKPPRPSSLWKHRRLLWRGTKMKPSFPFCAPVREIEEAPDLDTLPILKCWPEDGGRFITLPLVITKNPVTGHRNVGIYRMHVYGKNRTGMHIQIERGGGFHYAEAERRGQPLPMAVVLGADPLSMLSGILPLPEDMDELSFAGFLRGESTALTRLTNGVEVPANAEIVLEGFVPPLERQTEGPFGDHFGHYSHAAPFPVFQIERIHRRENPIYPAAVVGRPPQEDKFMGNAVQEMLLPLLKIMHPNLVDLWAYYETGFHNLAVASVKQRYAKEAIKTAFALLGQGQMSLSKCIILVDPDVNVRSFPEVLKALNKNFDPRRDLLLLPGTAQDTLDFTSFTMNLGSKMILDATSYGKKPTQAQHTPPLPPLGLPARNWEDTLLIVKTPRQDRALLERLVQNTQLAHFKIIAAVSDDVPLDNDEQLLWGIFTRFDCARDLVPARSSLNGAWPIYEGPLGIDATWKNGYPKPLVMDFPIVTRVNERWKEYGI